MKALCNTLLLVGLLGIGLLPLSLAGCASSRAEGVSATAPAVHASGSQLWAENCMRCHNMRSPSSLSDGEWETAVLHMRLRANLTSEESKAILQFLQAGN